MRIKRGVFLASACFLLSVTANAQPNFKVVGAKLTADPPSYEGPCPTTIKFHGVLETNGSTAVKYIFERSDGATDTIVKSTVFTMPPFHHAIPDATWTLGGPGMTASGWERIKILSPNDGFKSNEAKFQIKCVGGTQPGTPGTTPNQSGKPDLVVTGFGFKGPVEGQGQCKPQTAVYNFEVTVKNQGTAASPASTDVGSKALVQVMAMDKPIWANGEFLNALAPGASQTVNVAIYYLETDPAFMVNNAPHPFVAI